jgi:hypothetical protein
VNPQNDYACVEWSSASRWLYANQATHPAYSVVIRALPLDNCPPSPYYPNSLTGTGANGFHTWTEDACTALLTELLATYPINPDRIYLTGFSAGAMPLWILMRAWRGRVAGAIAASAAIANPAADGLYYGLTYPPTGEGDFATYHQTCFAQDLQRFYHIPLKVVSGSGDFGGMWAWSQYLDTQYQSEAIPLASRRSVLETATGNHGGMGVSAWPLCMDWLFAQTRPETPADPYSGAGGYYTLIRPGSTLNENPYSNQWISAALAAKHGTRLQTSGRRHRLA